MGVAQEQRHKEQHFPMRENDAQTCRIADRTHNEGMQCIGCVPGGELEAIFS